MLYEAILPLLQPSEDMVVRIEAAATLKTDILKLKNLYRKGGGRSRIFKGQRSGPILDPSPL